MRKPADSDNTDPNIQLGLPAGVTALPKTKLHGPRPGLGALQALFDDPEITEIMVNDVRNIMVERAGQVSSSAIRLKNRAELDQVIDQILEYAGLTLPAALAVPNGVPCAKPYLDFALPNGARVNLVLPPASVNGPSITIRKFRARRLSLEELVASRMLDHRMATVLGACVSGRINILIAGGTDTGKTTLLNALCAFISKGERVITIEDTPELSIAHPNSVRLQSGPSVDARELVANAMRMRPDRILLGECRRGEAFDTLQAMNTGHSGSMTTLHANSPRDALARMETLCLLAGVELPLLAIRKQMTHALDLVIQLKRLRNGCRKVVSITEVTGIEGDTLTLQEIFKYEAETELFRCTGFVPTFLGALREDGVEIPRDYFNG